MGVGGFYLVGMRTPPTLLSLMTPPMAVTRSLSLGLLVLWSWVSCRARQWMLATALPSPRLATIISPCLMRMQVARIENSWNIFRLNIRRRWWDSVLHSTLCTDKYSSAGGNYSPYQARSGHTSISSNIGSVLSLSLCHSVIVSYCHLSLCHCHRVTVIEIFSHLCCQ